MIDKLLITVFAAILSVAVAMQMLLYCLPLFHRLEFDAVCHKYTLQMDRAGGLNDDLSGALRQELIKRGFSVRQLSGTESAGYGGNLELYVAASIPSSKISSRLIAEEVIISFEYHSNTVCRVLKTFGAVP